MKVEKVSELSSSSKASGRRSSSSSITLRSSKRNSGGNRDGVEGEPDSEDDGVLAQYLARRNGVAKPVAALTSKGALNPKTSETVMKTGYGEGVSLAQHKEQGVAKTLRNESLEEGLGHGKEGSHVEEEEGAGRGNVRGMENASDDDDDFMTLDCVVAKPSSRQKVSTRADVDKVKADSDRVLAKPTNLKVGSNADIEKVKEDLDRPMVKRSTRKVGGRVDIEKARDDSDRPVVKPLAKKVSTRADVEKVQEGLDQPLAKQSNWKVSSRVDVEKVQGGLDQPVVRRSNRKVGARADIKKMTEDLDLLVTKPLSRKVGARANIERVQEDLAAKVVDEEEEEDGDDDDLSTLGSLIDAAKEGTKRSPLKSGVNGNPIAFGESQQASRSHFGMMKEDLAARIIQNDDCSTLGALLNIAKEESKQSSLKTAVSFISTGSGEARRATRSGKVKADLAARITADDDFYTLGSLINAGKEGTKQSSSKTGVNVCPTASGEAQEASRSDLEMVKEDLAVRIIEDHGSSIFGSLINVGKEGTKPSALKMGYSICPAVSGETQEASRSGIEKGKEDLTGTIIKDDNCPTLGSLINPAKEGFKQSSSNAKVNNCPIATGEAQQLSSSDPVKVKEDSAARIIGDDDCSTLVSLINAGKAETKQSLSKSSVNGSPTTSGEAHKASRSCFEKVNKDLAARIIDDYECLVLGAQINDAKGGTKQSSLTTVVNDVNTTNGRPTDSGKVQEASTSDLEKAKEDLVPMIIEDDGFSTVGSLINAVNEGTRQSSSKTRVNGSSADSGEANEASRSDFEKVKEHLAVNTIEDVCYPLGSLINAGKEGSKQSSSKREVNDSPTAPSKAQEVSKRVKEVLATKIIEHDDCDIFGSLINSAKEGTKQSLSKTSAWAHEALRADIDHIKKDLATSIIDDDGCSTLGFLIDSAKEGTKQSSSEAGINTSPTASGEVHEVSRADIEEVKQDLETKTMEDDDYSTLGYLIVRNARHLSKRGLNEDPVASGEAQEAARVDIEQINEHLKLKVSEDEDCSASDLMIVAAKEISKTTVSGGRDKSYPPVVVEEHEGAWKDLKNIKEHLPPKILRGDDCSTLASLTVVAKGANQPSSKKGFSNCLPASDGVLEGTWSDVAKIQEDWEVKMLEDEDCSTLDSVIVAAKEGSKQPFSKARVKINPIVAEVAQESIQFDSETIREDWEHKIIESGNCSTLNPVVNAVKKRIKQPLLTSGDKDSLTASDGANALAKEMENSHIEGSVVPELLPVTIRAARSKSYGRTLSKQADSQRLAEGEKTGPNIAHDFLAMPEMDISCGSQSCGKVSKGPRTARRPKRVVKFGFLDSQTFDRKMRKRKQADPISDGDFEWNALMEDAEAAQDGVNPTEKGKLKLVTGSSFSDCIIQGEAAAVAAGLRARAPGPTEKVRFKDILKRRGGLQEYIECRNMVLSLWEKDVQQLVSIDDCGVSAVPAEGESPRATLIRDIFEFLDYHGHINIGIAKKRLNLCVVESPVLENIPNSSKAVSTSCSTTSTRFDERTLHNIHGNHMEPKETRDDTAEVEVDTFYQPQEVEETGLRCNRVLNDKPVTVSNEESSLCATSVTGYKRPYEESELPLPTKKHAVTEVLPTMTSSNVFESNVKGLSVEAVNSTSFHEGKANSTLSSLREHQRGCDSDVPRNSECLNSAEPTNCGLPIWEVETIKSESFVKCEAIHPPETEDFVVINRDCLSGQLNGSEAPCTLRRCDGRELVNVNEGLREAGDCCIFPNCNQKNIGGPQHVIVVGAGPAGLAASRHMQRMNFKVTVLEARDRVGGRVYTDRHTFSAPVDLGASIITGVEADVTTERRADPSSLLCKQLGLQLTTLRGDCPLYDSVTGLKVPADVDEELEAEYNSLLDDTLLLVAKKGDTAMRMSLEEGLEKALKKRRAVRHCIPPMKDSHMDQVVDSLQQQLVEQLEADMSIEDDGGSLKREEINGRVFYQPAEGQNEFNSLGISRDYCHDQLCGSLKSDKERINTPAVSATAELNRGSSNAEPPAEKSQGFQAGYLNLSELERRIMDWHFANLEYGCAAQLCQVSLPYWNQDDAYGGFGGPHCMIKKGFGTLMEALAEGLDVRLGQVVTEIQYTVSELRDKGNVDGLVKVKTRSGDEFVGDAVLVTIPLGCLKADTINFVPSLPCWKLESIKGLGFGTLNKVVLEFPIAFWDESVDYFGATANNTESRGRCFMFWNLKRTTGAPILVALVVGKAALEDEKKDNKELVGHALSILRKLFGEEAVPEPKASAVTNWGREQYTRGAYSYVAVGASGEDYDILGRPVENCVFFAGEATCKEHPDTVGGAFMSGLREAIRIAGVLKNLEDLTLEAENLRGTQRHSESERNEVRDLVKRLAAADLSNALLSEEAMMEAKQKSFTRTDVLKDMFENAKTAAGRLLVAKEMLKEPVPLVKSFAGTKAGLTILNTWILDSMGKDATQLLRHCVRLLLVVATDLRSIRRSGIGKTVKEKVYMHTSRDIRAIAGQLVKMWLEIFQKEKSAMVLSKPSVKAGSNLQMNMGKADKIKPQKNKKMCTFLSSSLEVVKGSVSSSSTQGTVFQGISEKPDSLVGASVLDKLQKNEAIPPGVATLPEERLRNSGAEHTISDAEFSPLAAAKAAQAAAKANASAEAQLTPLPVLPEIVSFHKFAKREKLAVMEVTADLKRRKWPDLENPCIFSSSMDKSLEAVQFGLRKVSNWSLDLTVGCGNLNALGYDGEPISPGIEIPFSCIDSDTVYTFEGSSVGDQRQSVAVESNTLNSAKKPARLEVKQEVKLVQDNFGKAGTRSPVRECLLPKSETQSVTATDDFPDSETFVHTYEVPFSVDTSNKTSDMGEASNKLESESEKQRHTLENVLSLQEVKKAVSDYVVHLLTPLYKTRKLQKDGFKAIVKKTVAKVMEKDAPKDAVYDILEFLNCKRKNKIRALVDRFVEIHLSNPT